MMGVRVVRRSGRAILWAVLCCTVASSLNAQDAAAPVLAFDAGGHTSYVRRALFTPDGERLVTISYDKTIRVWDLASGESVQVLRPPIGAGQDGMLHTAALSPDGRLLAVAGGTATEDNQPAVLLISLEQGELIDTLVGHKDVIFGLAFSLDGEWLLSGSSDATAIVWNVATGTPALALSGHSGAIVDVAFSPDSRFAATASVDGTGAVWSLANGTQVATLRGHEGAVNCVAWSFDGRQLATGGMDHQVRLWSPNGQLIRTCSGLGDEGIASLAFTRDSRRLLYGQGGRMKYAGGPGGRRIVGTEAESGLIDVGSGRPVVRFTGNTNSVSHVSLSPDGALAATSGGNHGETCIWRTDNGVEIRKLASGAKSAWAAAWSADGKSIAWGTTSIDQSVNPVNPLEHSFDLTRLEFGDPPADDSDWTRNQVSRGSIRLKSYPKVDDELPGKPLTVLTNGVETASIDPPGLQFDRFISYTLLTGNRVAVGADSGLAILDTRTGHEIRKLQGHTGTVFALALSPDNRYLLSTSTDMTLKIWDVQAGKAVPVPRDAIGPETAAYLTRLGLAEHLDHPRGFKAIANHLWNSGDERLHRYGNQLWKSFEAARGVEPLLSLFFAGNDWIAWTPEGYYAASPGGERLMGWHVNNGRDRLASFFPAAQFRKQFYRPDVIGRLLDAGSVDAALAAAGSREEVVEVAQNLPPQIEIISPQGPLFETDSSEIQVTVRAQPVGPHPVTSLRLLLNGRPLGGEGGVVRVDSNGGAAEHTFTVPIISGVTHTLQARADSTVSYGLSGTMQVRTGQDEPEELRPALYVLAIGVADYDDPELRLHYADDDARNLVSTLEAHSGGLFRKVEVKSLVDKEATQRGILAGLGWLKTQMTQHDIGILFYSGHGDRDDSANFYLLPSDVDRNQPLLVSAVSDTQVKSILQGLPGRLLVLLDACHAGTLGGDTRKADFSLTDDLVRDLATDDYGIVVMASSMGREFSLENSAEKSGMFTLAIVEGLRGKADINDDAAVYFNELDAYVSERVKDLTRGRQHPVTAKPATIRSFPLSRIEAAASSASE